MLYGLGFESHRRYNFFSISNYVCDIVVKRFTFAISHLLMSACHIFVLGGDKYFKFGRQVDRSKSYSRPTDDKSFLKGARSGHVDHLNIGGH